MGSVPVAVDVSKCAGTSVEKREDTYNCHTVIVDVCILVEFVLEFCVFCLRKYTAGMQTCWTSAPTSGGNGRVLDVLVRFTLGLLETTVNVNEGGNSGTEGRGGSSYYLLLRREVEW